MCHLNTCPYGVCTQDEKLRKRFKGKPEYIVNFMRFVAQDLREIMARLGFHTIDEMVGRYDCLKQKQHVPNWKAATVNLKNLLFRPYTDASVGHHCTMDQDHGINATLDMSKLIRMCRPALEQKKHICARLRIQNTDRVTGALLGSEITRRYGEKGLPEDTISLSFVGSAGQSFGAFIPKGLTLSLEGDANDYVARACPAARSSYRRRGAPSSRRKTTSSSATSPSTARRAAKPTSTARQANGSASATAARQPSSKV